ncbi:MAG: ATP-binding protein [Cyclobacteriaceae bacterium]
MENFTILTIGLILGGALILLLAISRTHKIFRFLTLKKTRSNWRNLYLLMAFFFLGYVAVTLIVFMGYENILPLLTGVIFFFGAVFVFIVVSTGSNTLKNLQEVNEGLEEKIHEMKVQNQELQQFNYATSHDLQEPMNTVIGCVSMLQQDYGDKMDEKANRFMTYSIQAADRMKELILGLSDFLKIGRDRYRDVTDLDNLANIVIQELHNSIESSDAKINIENLPTLNVNAKDMKRVFQNLISNALKYRKPDVAPEITISAKRQDTKSWLFTVKDNGIGINENSFEKVFQIFAQLHHRDKYEGMGIGLSICKKVVELHGGKIWPESEVDVGTTFYFTLKS